MKRKRSPEVKSVSPSGSQSIDLDQLIEERKLEKKNALEQKRQEKLKIIRDRRTLSENHEQFPADTFERLQSHNIWENILGYLTDPCDAIDASGASETFLGILVERRKLMLLPKMLSAFIKGTIGPEFTKGTWRKFLKTCINFRGVSRAWKEIMDVQIFECDFFNDSWYLEMDSVVHWNDPRVFGIIKEEAVDRVFKAKPTSPSLFRKLYLSEYETTDWMGFDMQRYHDKMVKFLQQNGEAVWCMQFEYDEIHWASGTYPRLVEYLRLMPNLKALALIQGEERFMDEDEEEEEVPEPDFRRVLNQHPFPVLASLQFLQCSELDKRLMAQIFRKCVNLRSVQYEGHQPVDRLMLTALRKLSLERYEGHGENYRFESVILTSAPATWPLKKLTIRMEEWTGLEDVIKASVLFPCLHRFRETLEDLRIWYATIQMDTRVVRLDLPRLKSLKLNISNAPGMMGLDDLLLLKSLENLTVSWVDEEDENAQIKVKNYLEGKQMDKSNVWKCFPNLIRFSTSRQGLVFNRPQDNQL